MSVGGKVIEVIVMKDRVWVNTFDKHEKCAIYVELNEQSKLIEKDDWIWWQGKVAYWTPHSQQTLNGDLITDVEIEIPRIGFSGVNRPDLLEMTNG